MPVQIVGGLQNRKVNIRSKTLKTHTKQNCTTLVGTFLNWSLSTKKNQLFMLVSWFLFTNMPWVTFSEIKMSSSCICFPRNILPGSRRGFLPRSFTFILAPMLTSGNLFQKVCDVKENWWLISSDVTHQCCQGVQCWDLCNCESSKCISRPGWTGHWATWPCGMCM